MCKQEERFRRQVGAFYRWGRRKCPQENLRGIGKSESNKYAESRNSNHMKKQQLDKIIEGNTQL